MAAATYKVLGQVAPTGTSETTLYTVPSSLATVVSTLSLCNITTTTVKFSVNVRPAGASLVAQHALLRSVAVAQGQTQVLTLGLTLAATDVVSVNVDTANGGAVHLYGTEIA